MNALTLFRFEGRGARRFALGAAAMAVAIAIAASAATSGCGRERAESRAADAAPPILASAASLAVADARRLESGIPFTGELIATNAVNVLARFDGDLESVVVREGERVRKGATLARYRPRDVRDALQAADAEVLAARASLVAAQNNERRARRLLDAGAAAPREMEETEARRAAAEAQLRAAEARANRASEDAERLDVPSPIAGIVSRTHLRGGDRTAIGDPIMTIVATDSLELSAQVASEALGRVQPGALVRFRVDGFPGAVWEARVDRINPATEPGTRQIRIYTRIANADARLVSGLFASGRVIDTVRDGATAAPLAALRQEGDEQVVYRLRGGRASRVPVRVGLTDEEAGVAELIGAVGPGDTLLTGVVPGLRDSAGVDILDER